MVLSLSFQTTSDSENQFLGFDGYIDLGKELSMLHSLLSECVDRAPDVSITTVLENGYSRELASGVC